MKKEEATLKNRPFFDIFAIIQAPIPQAVYEQMEKTQKEVEEWFEAFEKKMRGLYSKYCETRIHDIKADVIATFIEEKIFGQEPEEILGVE